jgi:hypothetical protein
MVRSPLAVVESSQEGVIRLPCWSLAMMIFSTRSLR